MIKHCRIFNKMQVLSVMAFYVNLNFVVKQSQKDFA